jgi:response regulator of citrate/malate metabolism
MNWANRSFPFLERSIEVLIAEDEYCVADLHFEHLNSYKLYAVTRASSAKEADSILSSSKRTHVCMLDRGLTDLDNDEYYLIKKYSPKVSFIVVSARESLEKGFQACSYGAFNAISKPVDFYKLDFIDLINEAFLRSLIIPEHINNYKPVIKDAVDAFITFKPQDLTLWALQTGVEERYLRKVWTNSFGYQPKYALWLIKLFSHAFLHYKSLYCEKFRLETQVQSSWPENTGKQFKSFYRSHKDQIDYILKNKR